MNKENINSGLGQTLEGFYKVAVIDENDNVVYEQDWQKNLIVNTGMDQLYNEAYANAFYRADAGNGTRLNSIDYTGTTATADGAGNISLASVGSLTSFTASVGGYNTASQAGDMIKFVDGTEARFLTVGNTTATVTPAITINPAQSFVVWKTSQTGLQNRLKYAYQGVTDAGMVLSWPYTGTQVTGNVVKMRRTWDFPKQTVGEGSVNYTEIGVRTYSDVFFSRILLANPVLVTVNQRLRVSYELQVTFQPTSSVSRPSVAIAGWTNTNGSESIQDFQGATGVCCFSQVNPSNGQAEGNALLEPAVAPYMFVSTNSGSLQAFGSSIDRRVSSSFKLTAKSAYIPLSFYCDRAATFTEAEANFSNIYSMGVGEYFNGSPNPYWEPAYAGHQAFVFVFEQSHSKANTQTLTLGWRSVWNRTLS